MAGVCTGPGPCVTTPFGTGDNWVTKVKGLPPYIRAVAHALRRQGKSESAAIATAVATVKRWAAGADNVTPETRARAAVAVAEWEAKKAAAHALSVPNREAIDLAKGAMPPLPGTDRPRFPINSHSDLKKAIRAVGRAKGDHAKVRRHIIARAKALGAMHLIPDHWTASGASLTTDQSEAIELARVSAHRKNVLATAARHLAKARKARANGDHKTAAVHYRAARSIMKGVTSV